MSDTYTGRPRRAHRGVYLRGAILLLWAGLIGFAIGFYFGRAEASPAGDGNDAPISFESAKEAPSAEGEDSQPHFFVLSQRNGVEPQRKDTGDLSNGPRTPQTTKIGGSRPPYGFTPQDEGPGTEDEDLELLAIGIYQEAGGDGCSDDTRMKVGNVILNRVGDERFPDTVEGVLTQRGQYGRLYWTGIQWPDRADEPGEEHAVERAYAIARRLLNGERALSADVVFQAEFPQGSETVARQDGLYFCR